MKGAGAQAPAAPERILMIRRRGLGDALVTLPAAIALRATWPDAELDLIVDRALADLFDAREGWNVLAWDSRGGPGALDWIRRLRSRRYDLVIDFLSTPQTAVWTALSGARRRVGYDLCWRRWAYNVPVPRNRMVGRPLRQFAGESFLDPLRELGLAVPPWRPGLRIVLDETAFGDPYRRWRGILDESTRPRVGLVLSATWPAKAWPLDEARREIGRASCRERV